MTTKDSLVRDRQRFENYKAMFLKAFSFHEGETDPDYLKAKQGLIDYLNDWEARLLKQERAFKEQGRGR